MREITHIVLHCTATPQTTTVESIKAHWKQIGWKQVGYHFIILPSGERVQLLDIEKISNGVAGHNANSIHISYIGGVDAENKAIDNRTIAQKASQIKLILELRKQFPKAKICGHRDFPNVHKDCPSFDVAKWLKEVGL